MTAHDAPVTLSWPSGPMTLATWDSLPEIRNYRLECSEGNLIMAPFASKHHQLASWSVKAALRAGLGSGLQVVQDVEVVLVESPLTVRRPDVVV